MIAVLAFVVVTAFAQTKSEAPPKAQDILKDPPPDPTTDEPEAPKRPAPDKAPEKVDVPDPVEAPPSTPEAAPKRVNVVYYLIPTGSFSSQSQAVPRDKLVYGVISSRFGLLVAARPFAKWIAIGHVGFDASYVRQGVGGATAIGNGSFIASVPVEEASLGYEPLDWLALKIGHMRLPFSLAQSVIITGQMFPTRPGPSAVFNVGADDGLLVSVHALEKRLAFSLGAFNGGSLALETPGTTSVGPVLSAFVEADPLGEMAPAENDVDRGPLRAAVAFGGLLRSGDLYDATGYGSTGFRDARASASIRMSLRGFFFQAEYLRRVQTDDLSLRPAKAIGTYGELSYYVPVESVAFAPIARVGYSQVGDAEDATRSSTTYEAGFSFFPEAKSDEPDALRLILHYSYELRKPFRETSHAVVANAQIRW